jgi:hypothetical protein
MEGPKGRASVMDYPHPLTRLAPDGTIDLENAYATGAGEWDDVAIAYGYQDFPAGVDPASALDGILREARGRGLVFLTDQDARSPGTAHPGASLWDNGTDAIAELDRVMRVRRAALDRFGETAIRRGMPLAMMEDAFVPLFLHHRYQTAAAAKAIGGARYSYALRGDGQRPLDPVPAAEQSKAIDAVLRTIRAAELTVPRAILEHLPPRPEGYAAHRDLFARATGITFDPLAPADAATAITVSLLLDPDRVSRLVAQHALDPKLPGLDTMLDRLVGEAFRSGAATSPYEAEVTRTVRAQVVGGIERVASSASLPQARAIARSKLEELKGALEKGQAGEEVSERASRRFFADRIGRFLDGKQAPGEVLPVPTPPPGEPIGDEDVLGCAGE